ncbi:PREDICTED: lysyl oxidase homolog 2-like [Amphimedon queenslandica]|nr:PREDICTED: lysyl oxidase homolog 2-like [Amphimedon queenslandica]|eukprot:XP_019856379.1 PREDICTED: lysyl oxidase homolog 2-like [Amphimedon queenslandica]
MIRLQGGAYSNEGRVEVYCNGRWGTICDDGFSSTDARTVCKQLGYSYYSRYDHLSLPGSSGQPIWSTHFSSSSSSTCFNSRNSCPSSSITSCSHSEDVTVSCSYSSSYTNTATLGHCNTSDTTPTGNDRNIGGVVGGTVSGITIPTIVCITCCIIWLFASNKKRSTARLPPPTSSSPAIQLNTISRPQRQFTSTQPQQSSQQQRNTSSNNNPSTSSQRPPPFAPGYNFGDPQVMTLPNQRPAIDYQYPPVIALQQIPYPSRGPEEGFCSGEPPRYDELF